MATATVSSQRINISHNSHDTLGVSSQWAESNGFGLNEPVLVKGSGLQAQLPMRVVALSNAQDNAALLSKRMITALNLADESEIEVVSDCVFSYSEIAMPLASAAGAPTIEIPPSDLSSLDRSFPYHRIICAGSGAELVIRTSNIKAGEYADGASQTIKLDRYQRTLLKLEAPLELSWAQRQLYVKAASEEDRELIETTYENGLLPEDLSYPEKAKIYAALKRQGYATIYIAPLRQEGADSNAPDKRGLGQRVCDLYLESASLPLRCVRPYNLDEGKAVVRLSQDSMSLLGVGAGDVVRLRYGGKHTRARALCMESENEMAQTNLLSEGSSFNNLVGIPAALRSKLGINALDTAIEVERDTTFLFRKHLGIQFFSLIAMLFTIWQTVEVFDINPLHATIAFIVLSPVVLYIILSEERSLVERIDPD